MQILPIENPTTLIVILVIITLWNIPWKAMALWKSARKGQIGWFIFFLLVNSIGIAEIIYLYLLAKVRVKNLEMNPPKKNKGNSKYIRRDKIV